MKIRCDRFLLLLLLLLPCVSLSQPGRLDSLARVARSHAGDTVGVLTYADLCYEYRFVNQDSALFFGRKGIMLGKRLNFKTGLAQVYSDAATIHYDRGDFDSAALHWESSLALRTEVQDRARMASLQIKIGAAHFRRGSYDEALRYQLDALRAYEKLNIPQGIAQALNNAAAVYEHQGQLDNALSYYQRALGQYADGANSSERGITLINIGNIHFLKKDYAPARQHYSQALNTIAANSHPGPRAIAMNNLSEIYTVTNRYDSALFYSEGALALRRQVGDAGGIISSLNMMGRIQTKLRNWRRAEEYLREALTLATEKAILYEQGRIYENLYELYRDRGDWKKSLEAHVQYASIRDSLLNESGRKEVATLQVRYETEKKEQQIALQDAALAENQLRIERDTTIIIGLLITFALSLVIFLLLRNRQRRKADIQRKENEIALREAYIRATIESQEDERKRFARDLHDGLGQWISSLRLILAEVQRAGSDEEKLKALDKADGIMRDINGEFRSIAFNLMPQTLIHHGLAAALQEMARRFNDMNQTRFSVTAFEFPERLSELVEISLYRVVQEWTNNIVKYAQATRVEIQLTGHDDECIILIEDNGRGFDVSTLESGGNGWNNIRSRMNLIKGKVDVDSAVGRAGTTLTLLVPLLVEDSLRTSG